MQLETTITIVLCDGRAHSRPSTGRTVRGVRAIVVDASGPRGYSFAEVDDQVPGPRRAVLAVRCASLNHGDLNDARSGRLAMGAILGSDVAGTVMAAATDGSGPAVDSSVVALVSGGFAERVAAPVGAIAEVTAVRRVQGHPAVHRGMSARVGIAQSRAVPPLQVGTVFGRGSDGDVASGLDENGNGSRWFWVSAGRGGGEPLAGRRGRRPVLGRAMSRRVPASFAVVTVVPVSSFSRRGPPFACC
jgi:Alcohol dehydrogenase GroES-like domain